MKSSWKTWQLGLSMFIFASLSAFFFYIYYIRYYAWRNCFNDLGRCFNPDGSEQVYTTSSFIWIIPAVVFLLFFVIYGARLMRRIHKSKWVG